MKGSVALILATSVAVEAYSKNELVLQDDTKIGEVSTLCNCDNFIYFYCTLRRILFTLLTCRCKIT
jgi:hypothetical protein